jgi:uncharacterized membrane protein
VLAVLGNDTFLQKALFLLHILSALVAFAPAFVWPIVNVQSRKAGAKVPGTIAALAARNTMTIHGPAVVLTGLFGILLVVGSAESPVSGEKFYEFSQMWISLAFLVWFGLLGVVFGGIFPAEKAIAEGGAGAEAAEKKMAMFTGIAHTLLLVMLILMIWKPGL